LCTVSEPAPHSIIAPALSPTCFPRFSCFPNRSSPYDDPVFGGPSPSYTPSVARIGDKSPPLLACSLSSFPTTHHPKGWSCHRSHFFLQSVFLSGTLRPPHTAPSTVRSALVTNLFPESLGSHWHYHLATLSLPCFPSPTLNPAAHLAALSPAPGSIRLALCCFAMPAPFLLLRRSG